MHMHVFVFNFLNVWMTRRMLSTNLNYLFFQSDSTNNFLFKRRKEEEDDTLQFQIQKTKGRLRRYFVISNSKNERKTTLWFRIQKMKGRLRWHFVISNLKNKTKAKSDTFKFNLKTAFDTWNTINSNQIRE